jgi:hypothetical protein
VKAVVLEAWKYRNPEDICDGLIAESARIAKVPEQKLRERKDRYYSQSRSIHIKGVVKMAKLRRLHNIP